MKSKQIFFKILKYQFKIFFITMLWMPFHSLSAQTKEKDTLDKQVVNVVKPYRPKVADAFKIKEMPKINSGATAQKKPINYSIFSIPVASTFTPTKAKAASIIPVKKQRLFNNYALLEAGSYTTILGELFLNYDISETENIGTFINHHSSNGGIREVLLDNDFSVSQANFFYTQSQRDFNWKIDAGVDLRNYNWYGTRLSVNEIQIDNFNTQQSYKTFYGGGHINFEDRTIQNIKAKFTHFQDDFNSKENRFLSAFNFNLPILADGLLTQINIDYIDGDFSNAALANNKLNFGNVILDMSSKVYVKQGDLELNLGAQISYLNDFESGEHKFFFYPQVNASYPIVDKSLEIYAGIDGDLLQNSYQEFAYANPFVSPTLSVSPTDQQYNGFLGVRGKVFDMANYNLKGSYKSEKNKPFFQSNTYDISTQPQNFLAANSFNVVYDLVRTLHFSGELNVDISENFTFGLTANYYNYYTNKYEHAWNLPNVTGSVRMEYQISEDWFTGASLFYTGSRKDLITNRDTTLFTFTEQVVTINSFIDANAHVGYRINDQFTAFVKGNNLSGQNYELWTSYPVQGIQILGGVMYQFNF